MLYALVDANNFFIKNLFAYKSGMRKSERLFEKEEQIIEYSHIISNSLFSLIDKFDGKVGLVLCFDNKTWRKKYYADYKGHREYDDAVNWDMYFRFVDDFCEKIQDIHNVKVSKIEGSEADDLLYLWSKKLNNLGNDCIIISEDKDLHQLVRNTPNDNFTIVYNNSYKTPKLFKHPNTNLDQAGQRITIMNVSDALVSSRNIIKWILKEVDSVEDVETEHFLIKKILIGDDGDNVPSVWIWENNGKKKRITPSIADKIVKNFLTLNEKPLYYLFNDFEFFKSSLAISIKFVTGLKIDDDQLKQNIERNCYLMCLHHKFLPKEILKAFQSKFEDGITETLEKGNFLKGTKYYQDPRSKINKSDKLDSFFNAFGG
jgi:5'-3' exonuclease